MNELTLFQVMDILMFVIVVSQVVIAASRWLLASPSATSEESHPCSTNRTIKPGFLLRLARVGAAIGLPLSAATALMLYDPNTGLAIIFFSAVAGILAYVAGTPLLCYLTGRDYPAWWPQ